MNFPAQIVSHIELLYFKQYLQQSFEFHHKLNIITGNNGLGKTNLLDAIYYNCFLKSYFFKNDQFVFPFEKDKIQLNINIQIQDNNYFIKVLNVKDAKKQAWLNNIPIEKQIEIIGRFPIVFIEPYDQDLIIGSAENRRKFLDATLALGNPIYLQKLIDYQKLIKQKNALLKQVPFSNSSETILDIYNAKLIEINNYIFKERTEFITQFNTIFKTKYKQIFNGNEQIQLEYESKFKGQNIADLITQNKHDEILAQRTLIGIHNDDISFMMNEISAKKIASQGQQKTIVLALKFAQYEYIARCTKKLPLLFLDDIFDKLDMGRIQKILQIIHEENFGQIFITYTDVNRILSILQKLSIKDFKHILIN